MFAQTRDLSGLRIEEGTHRDIPQTVDPLDGTWTRPDTALKKMMFMQEAGVLMFMTLFMVPMFLILMISIDSEMWLFSLLLISPILILLLIVAGLSRWTVNLMYDHHKFRITDEELIIESGFMSTNRVLISMVQIQQVNVIETWMSKRYGLKSISVNTAGFNYVPNAGVYGGTMLLGLKNADDVADAILSRVKFAKSRTTGT